MSTEDNSGAPDAPPEAPESSTDLIKNLKAEMDRKLSNVVEENRRLNESLRAVLNSTQQRQQAPAPVQEEKLDDLIYSNPNRAAQLIEDRAAAKAASAVSQMNDLQAQRNAVLSQMVQEYPELNNPSSEVYKEAVRIYGELPKSEQMNPTAMRLAAREAAASVGLLPASKRKSTESADEFTVSSSSSSTRRRPSRDAEQADLDPNTLALAEIMGLNVKDKKQLERLKGRAQRKNWNKFE